MVFCDDGEDPYDDNLVGVVDPYGDNLVDEKHVGHGENLEEDGDVGLCDDHEVDDVQHDGLVVHNVELVVVMALDGMVDHDEVCEYVHEVLSK